jgi:hypothetical protein
MVARRPPGNPTSSQRGPHLAAMATAIAAAVIGLNAIDQMVSAPGYPLWSLTIIAMDVVALYGLRVYGSRQNMTAQGGTRDGQ